MSRHRQAAGQPRTELDHVVLPLHVEQHQDNPASMETAVSMGCAHASSDSCTHDAQHDLEWKAVAVL